MAFLFVLLRLSQGAPTTAPIGVGDTPGTFEMQLVLGAIGAVVGAVSMVFTALWTDYIARRNRQWLREDQERVAADLARKQEEDQQRAAAERRMLSEKVDQNTALTGETKDAITNGVLEAKVKAAVAAALPGAVAEAMRCEEVAATVKAAMHEEFKNPRAAKHFIRNVLQDKALWEEAAKWEQTKAGTPPPADDPPKP